MAKQKTMILGKGKNASAGLGGRAGTIRAHCGAPKHTKRVRKCSASPCFASLLPEEELRLCWTKLSVAGCFPMQFQQMHIRCCLFEIPFHLQGGRIIMLW